MHYVVWVFIVTDLREQILRQIQEKKLIFSLNQLQDNLKKT